MAASSITKNFVISGREQVEMFVNVIEESAKNRPVHMFFRSISVIFGIRE